MAARLVALGPDSGVHALVHPVDLVLGLGATLLGDAAIAVACRAQMLCMACQVVAAHGTILLLVLVPECTGGFGIGVVHLLCWL